MNRADRIAQGICVDCSQKVYKGTQRCFDCGVQNSKRGREASARAYAAKKRWGKLPVCPKHGKKHIDGRLCGEAPGQPRQRKALPERLVAPRGRNFDSSALLHLLAESA